MVFVLCAELCTLLEVDLRLSGFGAHGATLLGTCCALLNVHEMGHLRYILIKINGCVVELEVRELCSIPWGIALFERCRSNVIRVISRTTHVRPVHLLVRVNVDWLMVSISGDR